MSFLNPSVVRRQRNYLIGGNCIPLTGFCTADPFASRRCILLLHCDQPPIDSYFADVAALFHFNGVRDDYSVNNATLTYSPTARLDLTNSFENGQGSAWFPNAGSNATVESSVNLPFVSTTVDAALVWEMGIYPEAAGEIFRFGNHIVGINAGGTVSISGVIGPSNYVASFNQWHTFGYAIKNNSGVSATATIFLNGVQQSSTTGTIGFIGGLIRVGGNGGNFKGRVSGVRITIGQRTNMRYQTATAYNLQPNGNAAPGNMLPYGNTGDTALIDNSCSNPKIVNVFDRATPNNIPVYTKFNSAIYIPRDREGNASTSGIVVSGDGDFNLGTDEFTLAGWAARGDNTVNGYIYYFTESGGIFSAQIDTLGRFVLDFRSSGGGQGSTPATTVTLAKPFHWALQRRTIAGVSTWEFYYNGTRIANLAVTGGVASTVNLVGDLYFGRNNVSSFAQINGMLDEIVWVRGGTLFQGNFTPPAQPYCSCC